MTTFQQQVKNSQLMLMHHRTFFERLFNLHNVFLTRCKFAQTIICIQTRLECNFIVLITHDACCLSDR